MITIKANSLQEIIEQALDLQNVLKARRANASLTEDQRRSALGDGCAVLGCKAKEVGSHTCELIIRWATQQ